jgi:hypothetical protein
MIKAKISFHYQLRLALIGFGAFFLGLYFLYDGMVKYPAEQHVYESYQQIRETHGVNWQPVWTTTAQENNWPLTTPAERSDWDIYTQYICAAVTIPIGLFFIFGLAANLRRYVAMDEQGLSTHCGHRAPWDSIKSLDASKWKTKGIAVVHYNHNGKSARITLDDWKLHRDSTVAIFNEVQKRVDPQAAAAEQAQAASESDSPTSA